jgi:hypothetical protein
MLDGSTHTTHHAASAAGVEHLAFESESPVLRSRVDEATIVLMDNSASMSDTFRVNLYQDATQGATATLFVAFKRGSHVFEAPDTVNSILQYLEPYARAVNVRPHFHKETRAFKGSCHAIFSSVEEARAVLQVCSLSRSCGGVRYAYRSHFTCNWCLLNWPCLAYRRALQRRHSAHARAP